MINENGLNFHYEPRTIFAANDDWTYGREPILRSMPDGSLVCWVYSGGPREPDNDNIVLITRSSDRGETWSTPELLFKHSARAAWGTEIFTEGEVPFGVVNTFDASSHYLELCAGLSYTSDNGATWSEPVAPRGIPANVCMRQGIVLADGAWVFPVYWQEINGGWFWGEDIDWSRPMSERAWHFRSGCLRSDDQGKTFSLHGYLTCEGKNLWEPNIVETKDGLWMLIRVDGTGVLYESRSIDGGRTWSDAKPSNIPNPGTKVTLLKHGERILLLNNPTDCLVGRKRIDLWVSNDGGATWSVQRPLVEVDGNNTKEYGGGRMICYPHAFLCDEEETLYVAVDTKTHHYLLKVPYADFA